MKAISKSVIFVLVVGNLGLAVKGWAANPVTVPLKIESKEYSKAEVSEINLELICWKNHRVVKNGIEASGRVQETVAYIKNAAGEFERGVFAGNPLMRRRFARCDAVLNVTVSVEGREPFKTYLIVENLEKPYFSEGIRAYLDKVEKSVLPERLKVNSLVLVDSPTGGGSYLKFDYSGPDTRTPMQKALSGH